MKRESLSGLVFVLTALAAMAISLWTRSALPIPRDVAKLCGGVVFLLGASLFIWAVAHLKAAFLGTVEPVSNRLIRSGPYRWTRHPLYLSMAIMLVGLAVGLRSLWGITAIFALFVPAAVYRARLEEAAMAHTFGQEWEDYRRKTGLFIPRPSPNTPIEDDTTRG